MGETRHIPSKAHKMGANDMATTLTNIQDWNLHSAIYRSPSHTKHAYKNSQIPCLKQSGGVSLGFRV